MSDGTCTAPHSCWPATPRSQSRDKGFYVETSSPRSSRPRRSSIQATSSFLVSRTGLLVVAHLPRAVQASLDRPDGELGSAPQPQAVEDLRGVVSRGPGRDAQLVGKLLVAEPLRDARGDSPLARRQSRDLFARIVPATLEDLLGV